MSIQMAMVYVKLIKSNLKELKDVPEQIRKDVERILNEEVAE